MELTVTLSANAGVAICGDGCRVWVDAIHDKKVPGFSAVTTQLQQKIPGCDTFKNPEHILFTHCHPDHYSRKLAAAAVEIWPKAKLYLPEQEFDHQVLICGQTCRVSDDLAFSFVKLSHEGIQYSDVLHYGVILRLRDKNILLAGDCATASPALSQALKDEKIHMAVLNFPWITLKKGVDFVKTYLPEAKLLIYHLPFAEDDINGYRQAAEKAAERMPNVRLLMEPMQTEKVII